MTLYQLNFHQLSEPILRRLEYLATLCDSLDRKRASLHNPSSSRLADFSIKFPTRKPRDLELLWWIREYLPTQIRMEVERYHQKTHKLSVEEKTIILRLQDRVFLERDVNYLNGRALGRILWVLEGVRVNLVFPRKPKRNQRIRGYRDHGTMPDPIKRIRAAANAPTIEEQVLREWKERRYKMLWDASLILEMEKQGRNPQDYADRLQAERSLGVESRYPSVDVDDETLNRFREIVIHQEKLTEERAREILHGQPKVSTDPDNPIERLRRQSRDIES